MSTKELDLKGCHSLIYRLQKQKNLSIYEFRALRCNNFEKIGRFVSLTVILDKSKILNCFFFLTLAQAIFLFRSQSKNGSADLF